MKHKRSKLILAMAAVALCAAPSIAAPGSAAGEDVGVGLMVGSPTGLSAKYWMNRKMAFDTGIGASLEGDVNFHIHGDFLMQVPLPVKEAPGQVPLYMGIGPRIRIIDKKQHSSKVEFGIRLPIGVEFNPNSLPLNFFVELAPVLVATPEGGVSLDGAVGVRYRFGQ